MNENDVRMIANLIQRECIDRKHIEGTPTEWVVIKRSIEAMYKPAKKETKSETIVESDDNLTIGGDLSIDGD